jgi:hypothetical protein
MDILQTYALNAYDLYNSADPYLRPLRTGVYQLQAKAYPILLPYLNRAAVLAQDSPGIITIGLLLLFLLIAMRILAFVSRILMFWLRLATTLFFYAGLVLVFAAIWQRGVGRTADDLVSWGSELREVWWREYRRWDGYQNQAQRGRGNTRRW